MFISLLEIFEKMKRNELVRLLETEKRHENGEKRTIFVLKLLRILIHIVLALIVLVTAVTSKLSLILITNKIYHIEKVIYNLFSIYNQPKIVIKHLEWKSRW